MHNSESNEVALIVDDDMTLRLMVRRVLERRGIQVIEAEDGDRAIALLAERGADVVILDAMMPGRDGFETCRLLRATQHGADVPILMLSSLEDETSIGRAYEVGATDFFIKSPHIMLLAERVRHLLRTGRTRRELVRSRSILAKAQRLARVGSWEWDPAARTVRGSEEFFRIIGMDFTDQPIDDAAFLARLSRDGEAAWDRLIEHAVCRGETFSGECELLGADGASRVVQIEAQSDFEATPRKSLVLGTVQDLTESKRAAEHAQRLAHFDTLTGLPNRDVFQVRLKQALAEAARTNDPLAILFIDVDRLKVVNDTLGHDTGDALLQEVARRLNGYVRGNDSVVRFSEAGSASTVARFAGDQFMVLLNRLRRKEDAAKVAERMLDTLREPFEISGHEIWVSASIGVAVYPGDGDTAETLLMHADSAMNSFKAHGRNGHKSYTPSLDSRRLERFSMEAGLRKALERGEMQLYHQPIVDVTTGRIAGTEVLMRWQKGDVMMQPGEFIPVAEETGLIIPLGEWAIGEACRQVKAWHDAGLDPISVAVNLPGSHFQHGDVVGTVRRALNQTGLPAASLSIEITETVLMTASGATMGALNELRKMGVHIAIDDFGTGYSSLAYLKRLPIDTLKIDRSFVKDIAVEADDEAIVSAIIGLARSLKLNVVAEGVESQTQMAFLNMFGAVHMQGFLFSAPLPPAQFETLLRETSGGVGRNAWKTGDYNRVIHLFDVGRKVAATRAPA